MDLLSMKTDSTKKVIIKIASEEQNDNVKNTRKSLKVLQQAASGKENLIARQRIEKDSKMTMDHEVKRKKVSHKSVQTSELTITADDLTSDEPSDEYWRRLAEKRGDALNNSLVENEKLKDRIVNLEEENRICKEMLDESKTLIDVLQEIIGEEDKSTELAEEASEN